jgi:hypothetical protein
MTLSIGRLSHVLLVFLAGVLSLQTLNADEKKTPFMRGIALALFSEDWSYNYSRELDEIKSLNANYLSLVFILKQATVRSSGLSAIPSREALEQIGRVAMGAHSRGMRIMLHPVLEIQQAAYGQWRATLRPDSWEQWFISYKRAILAIAALADRGGIEMLCIGSELVSSEKYSDLWEDLIRNCRNIYGGQLLYSSNWTDHSRARFVKQLDYLGLSAYYSLHQSTQTPTLHELIAQWRTIQSEIRRWQKRFGKPVILTEIGYPSVDGCSRRPWDYTSKLPLNLKEQELCYQSFLEAWHGITYLKGIFVYNWWGDGGENDRDYTPRNKPAENVLRQWYLLY